MRSRRPSPAKKLTRSNKIVEKHRQHMQNKERVSNTTASPRSSHASYAKIPKMSLEEAAGKLKGGDITSGVGGERTNAKTLHPHTTVDSYAKSWQTDRVKEKKEKKRDKKDALRTKGHKDCPRTKKPLPSSTYPTETKSKHKGDRSSLTNEEQPTNTIGEEPDEHPSELPSPRSQPVRLSEAPAEIPKVNLSIGKKVKKNTKVLLSIKKPPSDRANRGSDPV